ncbi:hypothetical protein Cob_v013215 [Colletotrichum orbiculare MAFF 240422]|uniref:Uncharacterized protein n=1 Tax=Colletotrichum orbiculare (strain 104-T / ATCC 96160 / CBS 514.97 / LARS 414 / MAFF 240422) TaxID=1213857 RepID=N4VN66_COLOR|nr:hypothetical protein Cob_v013215 [Colletotrichum orbiculare MAFF 240422]
MASQNLLIFVIALLFSHLVSAKPLRLLDDTSKAKALWSREDDLDDSGSFRITIPPSDTTETQVSASAGGGGLGAYAILNEGGSILLVVHVDDDYTSDDFNGLRGYRIQVQCHGTIIYFQQAHDLLWNERRALWARVSGRQLDEWREEFETNEDSDIDITIFWDKDNVENDDVD